MKNNIDFADLVLAFLGGACLMLVFLVIFLGWEPPGTDTVDLLDHGKVTRCDISDSKAMCKAPRVVKIKGSDNVYEIVSKKTK